MNPEFPPIRLTTPQIKSRRREKSRPVPTKLRSHEERSQAAKRVLAEIKSVEAGIKNLSPDEKRAVFLKLTHDRPLGKNDLAGTELKLYGPPGENESLVIPKKLDLTALEKRIGGITQQKEDSAPKGIDFAENVQKISLADSKERLSEEFLEGYNEFCSKDYFCYEIEITSFADHKVTKHKEISTALQNIKEALGNGIRGAICDTDFGVGGEGARVLLWSNGKMLQEFVENHKWFRTIVFFDLRPNIKTFSESLNDFNVGEVKIVPPKDDDPIICVIDSGTAIGNPFLDTVIKKDISRSWVFGASPIEDQFNHGSGVASLAAFHSLEISDGDENEASAWIASARIMTDEGELDSPRVDDDEEDRTIQAKLLSTILREIVEHFSQEGVKIFVLSFEIRGHLWSKATRRQVSRSAWVARTIDQLSREFDVVFCCITGNLSGVEIETLQEYQDYPNYLASPLSKLLDPGPAALAITSGSLANTAHVVGGNHLPIAEKDLPSPFSRTGPGLGDCIKPDVVEYGGNLVFDNVTGKISSNLGTNILMASNKITPALSHANGTSFAAPRVANHLAHIIKDSRMLDIELSNCLTRALLCSSSTRIPDIEGLSKSEHLSQTGHGLPDGRRALTCEGHSALLYWDGVMKPNTSALFRIHVPKEFTTVGRTLKRISVSIAIAPPVQKWGVAEYLGSNLKFWLFRGDKDYSTIEGKMLKEAEEENIASKDTLGNMTSVLGIRRRSAGTLQSDKFEWQDHKESYSADDYTLAIALPKSSWIDVNEDIPIAVVVRIEETSGQFSELHSRVRAREAARSQVRAKA